MINQRWFKYSQVSSKCRYWLKIWLECPIQYWKDHVVPTVQLSRTVKSFFFCWKSNPEWSGCTWRQRKPVTLAVQVPTDLHQITVFLQVVLQREGLHDVGVSALPDPLDALDVALGEHARFRVLHGYPHRLVRLDLWLLPYDNQEPLTCFPFFFKSFS